MTRTKFKLSKSIRPTTLTLVIAYSAVKKAYTQQAGIPDLFSVWREIKTNYISSFEVVLFYFHELQRRRNREIFLKLAKHTLYKYIWKSRIIHELSRNKY